ncbi:MAG: MMPL family transporter [Candidatus Binatia bacterium]
MRLSRRISDGLGDLCLRYRKTVLLAVAAVSAFTLGQVIDVRFDNAIEIWFVDKDPALVAHQRLIDTYVSDELVVVGVEAPDVFAPEVLDAIDRMTRAIEVAPYVEKVTSITNIESITGQDDLLEIGDLIEFPLDPATLPAIRERALANELYVGNVVSKDGGFSCIIARLPHDPDTFDYKIESVAAIREIVDRETGLATYISGGPVLDDEFYRGSERDSLMIIPLLLGLLVAVLWTLMRSARGIIIPLSTVVLADIWAIGWMVTAGVRINVITTMLPQLLLAVGIADSMHVLVDYQNRCRQGAGRMEALRAVYSELTVPLFLTTLTTSIGMLSLGISRVQGIREFGIFAAIGVWGAFVLSVTFVPVVLSYLPPLEKQLPTNAVRLLSDRTLQALHRFTVARGRAIVAVSALLLAFGFAGATQVKLESSFLEIFKDDAKITTDTRRIEKALAGTVTMDVMIDTGTEGGVKEPELLAELERMQNWFESQELVSSSQSITGQFKDMRRAFFGNDQDEYKLPESREEAAQYLLLYEMDAPDGDIKEITTFDYSETRVSVRLALTTSNAATELLERTREYVATELPESLDVEIAGFAMLYANMEEYIRQSLVRSFAIALTAIFAVFCLLFGSIRLGAISMIPNFTPIVICLGFMGFAGINLDSMTAMVASVAIGLAVDDSIHFISRVRLRLAEGRDMTSALGEATVDVGRALVFTSITLCAGFGAMMAGSFVGMVYFGLLSMITIIFALAADLLLLPVVLRWYASEPGALAAPQRTAREEAEIGEVSDAREPARGL